MELIKLEKAKTKEQAEYVRQKIRQGGVVVCPTDTVYGLICDAFNAGAKERIYEIKKRTAVKPLIGFIPTVEKALEAADIPSGLLPFLRASWPGAVTFIAKGLREIPSLTSAKGEIGLRIPDTVFLKELMAGAGMMASTSANLSAEKAAASVSEIPVEVKDLADIVLDGGRVAGRESAIWHIAGKEPRLVRGTVLFVCEGNSCRSPMAEYYLKACLKKRTAGISVHSAGVGILAARTPPASSTVRVMREEGIAMDGFVSRPMTFEMAEEAAVIYVMAESQKERILTFIPGAHRKITVLDVPDPAGQEIEYYRKIRDIIKKKIEHTVLPKMWGSE